MKNSSILMAIGKDASASVLASRLEALRAVSARAVIQVVSDLPAFPYSAVAVPPYGGAIMPINWQQDVEAQRAAMKEKADEIEQLLLHHDVSGEVTAIAGDPSVVADAIGRRAMLCDMALIGEELRDLGPLFRQVVYGVLFQSPIGLMLNDHQAEVTTKAKRVFVAWNTHLHAGRAVHQALPILRRAKEVVVATIDPVMTEFREGEDPGVDVAKWLTHHGCTVVVQQYPSGGRDVGTCILDKARETGAELIVMGAYGHSRTREAFFGGTTRTLIEQTEQPVFLAH